MYKYSVLTFIFGDYECIHDVLDVQPNVEYICVTDNKRIKSNTWKIVYDNVNSSFTSFRKVVEVRYNPFKYVHSDICLVIDGSIQIKKFPLKLFTKFENHNYDAAVLIHPERSNLIEEIDTWKKIRNLSDLNVSACKSLLNNISYDVSYKGLFQVGLMLIRNTKNVNSLFKQVLSINNSCALRNDTFRVDQIIFSIIMNKYFSDKIKLLPLSSFELYGKYFGYYVHNTNYIYNQIDLSKRKIDHKYVFNSYVECFYIDNLIRYDNSTTAAICNFNTTTLTNNVVKDLLKYSSIKKIIILDNSNIENFELDRELSKFNIQIIDNTKQKYIAFDSLLKTYKLDKKCRTNNYASLKHAMSIQFLINITNSKYLLLCDSDIKIKKNIDFIDDNMITVADVEYTNTASENMNTNLGKTRFTPFIQLFNIKMMNDYKIAYFNNRMHGLENGLLYDTGASFYEDVLLNSIPFKKIENTDYITHLGHQSWKQI